jgi:hypothetical protein
MLPIAPATYYTHRPQRFVGLAVLQLGGREHGDV